MGTINNRRCASRFVLFIRNSTGIWKFPNGYHEVRQRPPLRFGWAVLIIGIAALILLRFTWPIIVTAFVLAGVTSVTVIVAVIVLLAAWLHTTRLSGRPF
jgi:uncharacterized membrane protein YwaF